MPARQATPSSTDVAEAARSFKGVKFRHQGRSRQYGIDCVGLIVLVAESAGVPLVDQLDYRRIPRRGQLPDALAANLVPSGCTVETGCVVLVCCKGFAYPTHCGICTGGTLIHSARAERRIAEHSIHSSDFTVISTYRFPGVHYGSDRNRRSHLIGG